LLQDVPEFVLENVMKLLNGQKKALNGAKVLLMGAAYKKDIDDIRESPTLKVIEQLEKNGADIMINDPFIPKFKHKGKEYVSVTWENEIKNADIVIITTDHSCYDYENIVAEASLLYDTGNATKHVVKNREKINKL
jgi:UDP-N-acetyl-D-glucosamine dehydrogenase